MSKAVFNLTVLAVAGFLAFGSLPVRALQIDFERPVSGSMSCNKQHCTPSTPSESFPDGWACSDRTTSNGVFCFYHVSKNTETGVLIHKCDVDSCQDLF